MRDPRPEFLAAGRPRGHAAPRLSRVLRGAAPLLSRTVQGAVSAALVPLVLQCGVGLAGFAPAVAFAKDGRPAAARQKVLLLRADLDKSGLTPNQGLQLTKDLFQQASRYRQLDVVLSSLDLAEEMFEFECTDAAAECLAKVGAKYAAQQVVYTQLEAAKAGAESYVLNMRVIDVTQARVAATTSQPLDNVDKSSLPFQKGLMVLLGPTDMPAESTESTGFLQLTLFGGGVALVYVDGKLAGRTSVTGLKIQVPAGMHTVKVVRAGYRDWSGNVSVAAGKTVEQAVRLEAQAADATAPASSGEPAKPITHKWWFWTGIGVVAVGVGVLAAVLASGDDKPTSGAASLGLGGTDAWRDPVFGRTGP